MNREALQDIINDYAVRRAVVSENAGLDRVYEAVLIELEYALHGDMHCVSNAIRVFLSWKRNYSAGGLYDDMAYAPLGPMCSDVLDRLKEAGFDV